MRVKDGSAELLPPGGPSMRHPDRGMGTPLLADRGRPGALAGGMGAGRVSRGETEAERYHRCCALRSDRPAHRRASLRASGSSDRSAQESAPQNTRESETSG
jgi:hypothetical protein